MGPLQILFSAIGRICLSLIFIFAGISTAFHMPESESLLINAITETSVFVQTSQRMMTLLDLAQPISHLLILIKIAVEILGGLLIFLGIKVRFGAFILAVFMIPATFLFHHFWWLQGPDRELQTIMFLKNLSIFGGLLILLSFGKGHAPAKKEDTSNPK